MKMLSVISILTTIFCSSYSMPPNIQIPRGEQSKRSQLQQLSPTCIQKNTSKHNIACVCCDSYLLMHEIILLRNSHNWDLDALMRDTSSFEQYELLFHQLSQNVHDVSIGTSSPTSKNKKKTPNKDKNYSCVPLLGQSEEILRNGAPDQVRFLMSKLGRRIEEDISNNFEQNVPSSVSEYTGEFERIYNIYKR